MKARGDDRASDGESAGWCPGIKGKKRPDERKHGQQRRKETQCEASQSGMSCADWLQSEPSLYAHGGNRYCPRVFSEAAQRRGGEQRERRERLLERRVRWRAFIVASELGNGREITRRSLLLRMDNLLCLSTS
jgi:hypothetical protein